MALKVLIVEDDKALNEMYAIKFNLDGFLVETAFDGTQWIEKIDTFRPDVILLDIMMPGLNGFDSIEVIKKRFNYGVKIIVFTNLDDFHIVEKALALGADDCVLKANMTPKQAVLRVKKMFGL